MVMGLETQNDCDGYYQQQITRQNCIQWLTVISQ
jgi:hypothetical protein